jgi:nucleoside-diphosphate-sugar epimerase
VHLYDGLIAGHGGSMASLEGIADRVQVTHADLRDGEALDAGFGRPAVVFDLAGQSSHWDSMVDPHTDLEHNCTARLALLDAVRRHAPRARIVFASTRQIYGRPAYLPVDEEHPVGAVDVNGIHKIAGESYHRLYAELDGLSTTILRLTNTLGPRMRIRDARQTFVGLWIRCALERRAFEVWGGEQLRDFNDVDDVVDALLAAAIEPRAVGRTYNLGAAPPSSLLELARMLQELCDAKFEVVPFPAERRAIDIGDYYASHARISAELGWRPVRPLRATLERTLAYFAPRLAEAIGSEE